MSGLIASPFPSMNDMMAPQEFWRRKAQTDVNVQNAALQRQKQERELEGDDYQTIANTAGHLLSLPDEPSRAAAWGQIYPTLPDHLRARAPSTYQGEGWAKAAMARAVPALDQWKMQQQLAANRAILGDGGAPPTGGGGGGGGSTARTPLTPYVATNLPPGVTPEEDQYVRTVWGESRGETAAGQQAVAYTIKNRSKAGGESSQDVIFRPNAYEPWNNPTTRKQLEALDPNSPEYQRILTQAVRPVLSGQAQDPTGGATHFYSPAAQAALGRDAPSWATGNQTDIGNHRFFYPGYAAAGGAPARGVAARTGGTDVASNAPVAVPTSTQDAPASPVATAGSPPNRLTAPPGTVPTPVPPPPPAAPQAPVVQSAEQIAARLGLDSRGLTAEDRRVLSVTPGPITAVMEQMRSRNETRVQQEQSRQHQQLQDWRATQKDQAEAATRGLPPGYRWAADGKSMERIPGGEEKGIIGGASGDNAQMNALVSLSAKMRAGTATDDERATYGLLHGVLSNPHKVEIQDPADPTRRMEATYPGIQLDPDYFPPPKGRGAAGGAGGAGAAPGAPQPIPGTSTRTPQATEAARKSAVEVGRVSGAIDDYLAEVEKQGGVGWRAWIDDPTSAAAQTLNAKFEAMKQALRGEVFLNTGVLQKFELDDLNRTLLSPQTLRGVFATPEALRAKLGGIRTSLQRYQELQEGKAPAPSGSTPSAPAQPQYQEGQTATGPGNKKMIFRNGGWTAQ